MLCSRCAGRRRRSACGSTPISPLPWGLRFLRECTRARARRNTLVKLRLCQYSQGLTTSWRGPRGSSTHAVDARRALPLPRPARARGGREEDGAPRRARPEARDPRRRRRGAHRAGLRAGAREDRGRDPRPHRLERRLPALRRAADGAGAARSTAPPSPSARVSSASPRRRDRSPASSRRTACGPRTLRPGARRRSRRRSRAPPGSVCPSTRRRATRRRSRSRRAASPRPCPASTSSGWSDGPGSATRLRLTSTAEFAGYDWGWTPRDFGNIMRLARDLFPDAADYGQGEYRACLRPMTPDGPPILGLGRHRNLFFNSGHGHMGWTMACGTAPDRRRPDLRADARDRPRGPDPSALR